MCRCGEGTKEILPPAETEVGPSGPQASPQHICRCGEETKEPDPQVRLRIRIKGAQP
jgi:hypothetical protein